eukprot:6910744-Prymnesium_polylepis.1
MMHFLTATAVAMHRSVPRASLAPSLRASHRGAAPWCCATGGKPWTPEEDWALVDAIPEFTAGADADLTTFWTALAASSTVLFRRSADECARRMETLA